MANLKFDDDDLRPLIRQVVETALDEASEIRRLMNGKIALTEAEAAALLGLNSWQLRDERLAGKVSYSRIVGSRVRYTLVDLLEYLRQRRETGTPTGK